MVRVLSAALAFIVAALPLAAAVRVSSLSRDLSVSLKERPVMKVVRLLQDMKAELQAELDDDKNVNDKLSCWCETNEKEKTAAIELGESTVAQLESSMSEAASKMVALKEKRKATMDQMYADQKSLDEAEEMRMTENKAFHGEETGLLDAVAACKQAIVVLSKHHPELAQVRAVALKLQESRVPELSMSRGLRPAQLEALKGFLQQAVSATSFLAVPGFQSYRPQSGQIFGVLKQMQEDFEKDLSGAQSDELKAVEQFESLKAAKLEEIAAADKAVIQIDADLAEFGEKHAQELKEFEDTKAQLALDQEFLASLQKKCSESSEEYDARVKSRLEEIAAVEDTIKILNTDEAFDVFDKSVSTAFLQLSTVSREEQVRRQRATSVLRRVESLSGAPQLALIIASAQLDTFDQVKVEIDKLIAELGRQQQDEVEHRDWCTEELAENERSTAQATDKKESLSTKIADLDKTIETLAADIKSTEAAVSEMKEQMKRSSENREGEHAVFAQTISDQRLTQVILNKALNRMKQVYAMLQEEPSQPGAAHTATSGNHTDAGNGPARFTKYEQHVGGSRVVAMLETVISDSQKMEDEAIQAEDDAQTAYETFMKDSNKSVTQSQRKITNMKESSAKAKSSLSMAQTDLDQTGKELEGLNEMLGDTHKSCDFVLKNFEARQEARSAEVDALKEAKAILSGMA
mmetsp:Transcript_18653/g.40751  ORF Transcript_18653/g.40751 Transcript_18653/m.40751 type:complete len:692 (-) Transcript_18653:119-2194(-)